MTRRIPILGSSPTGLSKATFVVGVTPDNATGDWTPVFKGEFYRNSAGLTLPPFTPPPIPSGYSLIKATQFDVIEAGALNGRYTVSTPLNILDYDSSFLAGQTTIRVNENVTSPFIPGGFITNVSTFFLVVSGGNPIIVPPGVEIDDAPVPLLGRSFSGWAEVFQQNMLRGLQNFSGSAPPADPVEGMLWFNPTANTLLVFRSSQWVTPNSALVPQVTASTSWVVTHNLNLDPPYLAHSTFFVQNGPDLKPIIPADVTYTSANSLTVTFSSSYSGYTLVSR
jgi:hypothetical protein